MVGWGDLTDLTAMWWCGGDTWCVVVTGKGLQRMFCNVMDGLGSLGMDLVSN